MAFHASSTMENMLGILAFSLLCGALFFFCYHNTVNWPATGPASINSSRDELQTAFNQNKLSHSFLQDPAFNLTLDPNKKLILLLTSFRGGSTFLGKLFDSNPNMHYHFEPFYDLAIRNLYDRGLILGARPDHTESDLRMLYLQQILHNCTVYGSWFPEMFEFCGAPEENVHLYNSTECDRRKFKWGVSHRKICGYRSVVVLKVIRQQCLSDILKIAQIKSADIKIIHLLRHPTPLMVSRRTGVKYFSWDRRTQVECEKCSVDYSTRRVKLAWEVFNYCYNNLKSIQLVEDEPWLHDRYMRVTHHEMSLKPLQTAQKVYNFVGEPLSGNIREFVVNMTEAQSEAYKNRKKDGLEVFKNSTEVLNAWKDMKSDLLRFWDFYSIEAQCKSLFEVLDEDFSVDSISLQKLSHLYFL